MLESAEVVNAGRRIEPPSLGGSFFESVEVGEEGQEG